MQKFLTSTALLGTLLLLGVFVPHVAQAQKTPTTNVNKPDMYKVVCQNNAACLSFDPAVNPMLEGYVLDKGATLTPSTQPDGSSCVSYVSPGIFGSVGAAKASGCLKNGVFTIDGYVSAGADLAPVVASTDSTGQSSAAPVAGDSGPATCGMLHLDVCIRDVPGYVAWGVAYFFMGIANTVLWLSGTVFNWVVLRTVFEFGEYFGASKGMLVAWGVLRDIGNIALLFGFIFMGIATILNTHSVEGYTARKALPQLIIFAVLMNFSLFATQAVIDVANGFSSVFTTFAGQSCDTTTSSATTSGQSQESCTQVGISGKMLAAVGMAKVWSVDLGTNLKDPYHYAAMLSVLSIFIALVASVLLAGAIMLIIRVVSLSFLMVTSPIGFAGMAVPALHGLARDWWHRLINQAFFAPAYLLMLFLSLKLVEALLQEGNAVSIPDAIMGNTLAGQTTAGNMQVVMLSLIVVGFFTASLAVAQKMGATGASFATKTAGGLAFGVQGMVYRRTIGRVSNAVANNIAKSEFARKNPDIARIAYNVANKGATASLSTRNAASGFSKAVGLGVDFGKADKAAGHGFHGIEEKMVKDRTEFAKKLKNSDSEEARLKQIPNDIKEQNKMLKDDEEAHNARMAQLEADMRTQIIENKAALEPLLNELNGTQKQIAEARAAGNEKLANDLELSYNNKLRQYDIDKKNLDDLVDTKKKAIGDELESHKRLTKQRKDTIAALEKEKTEIGKAPQLQYAKTLADRSHEQDRNIFLKYATVGPLVDHHAAEAIVKNANKSKLDKALESIKEETEKASKNDGHGDDHGGGGDHGGGSHGGGGGNHGGGHGGGGDHGGGGGHH